MKYLSGWESGCTQVGWQAGIWRIYEYNFYPNVQLHPSSFLMDLRLNIPRTLSHPSNVSCCLQTLDGLPTILWYFKPADYNDFCQGKWTWPQTPSTSYCFVCKTVLSVVKCKASTSLTVLSINTAGYLQRQFRGALSSAIFSSIFYRGELVGGVIWPTIWCVSLSYGYLDVCVRL